MFKVKAVEFFLSPSGSKNGFSAQQPEQTGRLSPFIVVVLFGSGLGRMPGYLDKDRSRNPLLIVFFIRACNLPLFVFDSGVGRGFMGWGTG